MQQDSSSPSNCLRRFFTPLCAEDMSAEELLRYRHFSIFILLGLPLMAAFGLYHLFKNDFLLCLIILISAAGLLAGWLHIRKSRNGQAIYRTNGIIYLGLLIYVLTLGGEDGSKALWLYTIPMIGIFLLGKIEGLFWSLAALFLAGLLTTNTLPGETGYLYSGAYQVRFCLTYLIVTVLSFSFEHLRQIYRQGMEIKEQLLQQEKEQMKAEITRREELEKENELSIEHLQKALAEVEKLRGLLPMCASCRKIRNDSGFWKDIETYLEDHSEVQFTHGLCPSCVTELYPFMAEAGKDTGNPV